MLQTEYVRSLHTNYEKITLVERPEEEKYQYCILSRGGIKGLLSCSLRYMNGNAFLYYDITSKQNVAQLFMQRCIKREWLLDFVWAVEQIQQELGRFLLDERNLIWYPEQIFQDVESNDFSFLYIPYYEETYSFLKFMDFLVDRIDYEDEELVECVYRMYEHCEQNPETYLSKQIFSDAKTLKHKETLTVGDREMNEEGVNAAAISNVAIEGAAISNTAIGTPALSNGGVNKAENYKSDAKVENYESEDILQEEYANDETEKKGIRFFFDSRRRRAKSEKENYQKKLQLTMGAYDVGVGVAEDLDYADEEDYGQTVYVEEVVGAYLGTRRLCTPDGQIVVQLENPSYTIGKRKEEVDIWIQDASVSRMHARIVKEENGEFLEDLNSTNGTYKNGLRMQPYEKRKLEVGDEIKLGKAIFIYR